MLTPITIQTATYQDAESIAQTQISGWRASYQDIVPESHLNNLSVSAKTSFWQRILIDPVQAKEVLVARRRDQNSSDQSGPQILGFVTFGSAGGSSAPRSDVEAAIEASRQGELRAIYVDPRHFSEGVGRCLWTAAQEKMVEIGCSEVVVWVFAGNDRAIRFYHKAGFTENQNGQTEVGGATVVTIELSKTLQ
ncbi:hypothetical protein MBLNU13_g02206t1 [Cladosporium sp. NU13]